MSKREFDFRLSYRNWPLWTGVLLILIGSYFAISIDKPDLFTKLVIAGITEFGFAFFISHIIIITVDRREKRNFLEMIHENRNKFEEEQKIAEKRMSTQIYLSHVLDVDLPKTVSDELASYLLNSKFVKREQSITYEIEKMGNYTKFTQILEAVYENISKETVEFDLPYSTYDNSIPEIEANFSDEFFGIADFCIQVKGNNGRFKPFDESRFSFDGERVKLKTPPKIKFGDQVKIRIVDVSPKYGNDNEIFTNTQYTEELNIKVNYSKLDYDTGYRTIHPRRDCMEISAGYDTDHLQFYYPFLPSNGVIVWWKRKDCADPYSNS